MNGMETGAKGEGGPGGGSWVFISSTGGGVARARARGLRHPLGGSLQSAVEFCYTSFRDPQGTVPPFGYAGASGSSTCGFAFPRLRVRCAAKKRLGWRTATACLGQSRARDLIAHLTC